VLVPGNLLSTIAAYHNWSRERALVASNIEGICVACGDYQAAGGAGIGVDEWWSPY
jgi:hypothetical protein